MRRGIAAAMAGRLQGSGPCWLAASGTRYILYPGEFLPQPVGRVKRFSTFTINSTGRTHRCLERTDANSSESHSADRPAVVVPPVPPASLRLGPRCPPSQDSRRRSPLRFLKPRVPARRRFRVRCRAVRAAGSRRDRFQHRTPPSRSSGFPTSVPIYGGSRSRPG